MTCFARQIVHALTLGRKPLHWFGPNSGECQLSQQVCYTYRANFPAFDKSNYHGGGLHKDALGYTRQGVQVST